MISSAKVAYNILGITSVLVGASAIYLVPGTSDNIFYLSSTIRNRDFLNNHKEHIYWKKLGIDVDWEETKDPHNHTPYVSYDIKTPGKEIYETIWDHTFWLNSPCSNGTGWILDFEIPTDNTYPKTWWIATNMHVVKLWKFKNNDYNVVLPIDKYTTYHDIYNRQRAQTPQKTKTCQETFENEKGVELTIKHESKPNWDSSSLTFPANDITWKEDVVTPKLFYSALNFLGNRSHWYQIKQRETNYLKDFAVLEITFDTPDKAKEVTNDFYTKYYADKTTSKKQPINVFAPEIISQVKTYEELKTKAENTVFYTGGYSKHLDEKKPNDKMFWINNNILQPKETSTHMSKTSGTQMYTKLLKLNEPNITENGAYSYLNHNNEPIIGHSNIALSTHWNNTTAKEWGYSYVLNNMYSKHGQSGSMVIDKDRNLLGIFHAGDEKIGFVSPLNGQGIFDNTKIISPRYDLIKSVEGQPTSYKQQLEKYHGGKNTYLKSMNWSAPKKS